MTNQENWKKLIKEERANLEEKLSDLEISALEDWYDDCYEGFEKIFRKYSEKLGSVNNDKKHDAIVEIFHELQHIKMHIQDAENGFVELMNSIEKKTEKK